MENLYQEIILDHYQHPRNYGTLNGSEITTLENPSCGDSISMQIKINGTTIQDIAFQGKGCAISQATASLLTEYVKNRLVEEVYKIDKDVILSLLGVELSPARLKCALLPLETLKKVLVK